MLGQAGRGEEGGGAVGAADDADGAGLLRGEAQQNGQEEGAEDAQLGRAAQQNALGVGQQGAEVGHGAHAQEDEGRVDAQLHAQTKVVDHAAVVALHGFHDDGAVLGDVLYQMLTGSQQSRTGGVGGVEQNVGQRQHL